MGRDRRIAEAAGSCRVADSSPVTAREMLPTSMTAPVRRKVFRLDGAISRQEWSEIAALWFRGNTLASEYLEGLTRTAEPSAA